MDKLTTEVQLILSFLLAFFLEAGPAVCVAASALRQKTRGQSARAATPHPPKCGGELYQRADDTVETMTNRLNVYVQATRPLIEYYKAAGVYTKIDGRQPIEKVTEDLVNVLTSVKE